MSKRKKNYDTYKLLTDGVIAYLCVGGNGDVIINLGGRLITIEGVDKEAYVTSILAGFEETGFRFIKEL